MVSSSLAVVFVVLVAALWLWAAVDIVKTDFGRPSVKLFAILGVLFFPVLGPLVYFLVRKHLIKEPRKFDPDFNR